MHVPVGIAPEGVPARALRVAHQPVLVLQGAAPIARAHAGRPHLLLAQRILGRRADQVLGGHDGIRGIEHGALEGAVEEGIGVGHQVLVQRVRHGDEHDQGLAVLPRPPGRCAATRT